jgi:uncharacterized protein (DUF302 family)
MEYGTTRDFPGSFSYVVERVKAAFKEEGFGVLSEIDVKANLKERIGEEIEPYLILGMCNPNLAVQAIRMEHEIGLLLPCNVLVHECQGAVHVSVQDPEVMLGVAGNSRLSELAAEVKQKLASALKSV